MNTLIDFTGVANVKKQLKFCVSFRLDPNRQPRQSDESHV